MHFWPPKFEETCVQLIPAHTTMVRTRFLDSLSFIRYQRSYTDIIHKHQNTMTALCWTHKQYQVTITRHYNLDRKSIQHTRIHISRVHSGYSVSPLISASSPTANNDTCIWQTINTIRNRTKPHNIPSASRDGSSTPMHYNPNWNCYILLDIDKEERALNELAQLMRDTDRERR